MRKNVLLAAVIAGVFCGAVANNACGGVISYSAAVPTTTTPWGLPVGTITVSIPQFDPALGTLNSITFEVTGKLTGQIGFENTDETPQTVNYQYSANVTLYRPDISPIVVVTPAVSGSDNLAAFDSASDNDGDSGNTYYFTDPPNPVSDTATYTSPPPISDLALFTGTGSISLPVSAVATSTIGGSGNLDTLVLTSASADIKVTYDYNDNGNAVPEPSSLLSFFCVAAAYGLARVSRRRKATRASAS